MSAFVQNKKITEEDTKYQYITPAIESSGWEKAQFKFEYFFTDGQVIVRGNAIRRGERKKADYILFYKPNIPLAIIEAKGVSHSVGDGMQQALEYGHILDVPFVFSSNGKGFLEHDRITGKERELSMDQFPTQEELWSRFSNNRTLSPAQQKIIDEPYYYKIGDFTPRYYQRIAINRTVEAIADNRNRILLVMATGTGKTYTAFQIVHRLWKSGIKRKILYLADRNVLIDQTRTQDFRPFEKVMCKIGENRSGENKLDSAYEIYLSLYQQLAGDEHHEPFREFSPDFFDLIIVDECHRGSAKEESAWRRILDYFTSAAQIGMTATPKETTDVSNIDYFGSPLYTYSLKQGIEDGFLAPYKVVRVGLNIDLQGYRPEEGTVDTDGEEVDDREYTIKDFDRNLVIDERTQLVAHKITEFLKKTNRMDKTIVFCIDIDHAERMRQALVNENSDKVCENPKYIMRITGDNETGKAQLENFQAVDTPYPVIVTTSKLMTTGCDCKTCKLIVLDNNINSMTEFKQIIGRGTRLRPDYNKLYFTIIDFRNSTRLFADKDFDGEPVQIYEPEEDESPVPPEGEVVYPPEDEGAAGSVGTADPPPYGDEPVKNRKIRLMPGQVLVKVLNERVQYYDIDGKLITESITDYSRRNILQQYATLDAFLKDWNADVKKQAVIDALATHGVLLEALREESGNSDLDDFDLICHIAYDRKPLTKADRINNVKKRDYFSKYEGVAREVLDALLEKYKNAGIEELENLTVLQNEPFTKYGSPISIANLFGGKNDLLKVIKKLQDEIYAA